MPTVHPHMRGEDPKKAAPPTPGSGSPPHAWGRRPLGQIIQQLGAVHPHMRGEDDSDSDRYRCRFGSPPHAWGRPPVWRDTRAGRRFTPTCVGKTYSAGRSSFVTVGSPPHAWGRLYYLSRNIAYIAVHPHMRGEDSNRVAFFERDTGSPPHAWGRHPAAALAHRSHRFTPTCVGKTCSPPRSACRGPVHPHMRGEDLDGVGTTSTPSGSPPHAWGRPRPERPLHLPVRFTPTCVGKTRIYLHP